MYVLLYCPHKHMGFAYGYMLTSNSQENYTWCKVFTEGDSEQYDSCYSNMRPLVQRTLQEGGLVYTHTHILISKYCPLKGLSGEI